MEPVSVKKLMNVAYLTIDPDSSLQSVATQMIESRLSCMVVVEQQRPIGIVTERDMVHLLHRAFTDKNIGKAKARDVMSSPPVVIEEHASMFDALVLTQARRIRHLPVVDNQGLIKGILSHVDLAQAHLHVVEIQREMIEQAVERETTHLKRINQQLLHANGQLKELSMVDALMRIGNRRAMEVDLSYTHNAAVRYKRSYSVVLFDIDYFKQYNDHYGHAEGDEALRKIGKFMLESIRTADRLYRYGGEEILLILPETNIDGAKVLADRIVQRFADMQIPHVKSSLAILTLSAGVGYLDLNGGACASWHPVVSEADQRLYEAKRNGRNQVFAMESGTAKKAS